MLAMRRCGRPRLTAHRRALLDMSAPAPRRCLDCDAPLSWKAVAGGGVVCSTCGPGRNGCRTSWNATYKKHLGAFPNEQTTLEIRATMKNSMKEKRGKRKAAKKSAAAAAPLPQPHERSPARKKKAPSPSFDSSEEEELRGLGLTQPLLEEEVKQLKDQLEKEKSAGILIGEMRGRAKIKELTMQVDELTKQVAELTHDKEDGEEDGEEEEEEQTTGWSAVALAARENAALQHRVKGFRICSRI
eukprot:SAG25_NODE_547_length_7025_cov_3.655357_1_plen_244_part_00